MKNFSSTKKMLFSPILLSGYLAFSFSSPASTAEFIKIDGLVTSGQPFSEANGVSDDGRVVVGMSATNEGTISGFRWKSGATIDLGALPSVGPNTSGQGISGNGDVLVGRGRTVDEQGTPINAGWMWTENGGIQDLGRPATYASDASYDGSVIVGKASSDNSNALRWTIEQGSEIIPPLNIQGEEGITSAHGVSGDGATIVGESLGFPFYWQPAQGTLQLSQLKGQAYDVNEDGSIIVGSAKFNDILEAFRWTEATGMVSLGLLPGDTGYSRAKAISANGQVIVGTSSNGSVDGLRAFIWDAQNGMRDLASLLQNQYNLDLQGLTLTSANGVSADGSVIVGRAVDANDNPSAWMVDFQTPTTSLSVQVLSPVNQATFYTTDTITLQGSADDSENGDISSSISWSSNLDGSLGQGSQLNTQLSAGNHQITAEVTNEAGDVAYTNIDLRVLETPQLELSVSVRRVFFFFPYTTVRWTGGTDNVEIYKNGSVSRTGSSTGEFTEYGQGNTYQVCQVNTNFCTERLTAR